MKNYSNVPHSKGLQQRKSSFVDPYESGRRKAEREAKDRESQYAHAPSHPFPHLETPSEFNSINNISSNNNINKYKQAFKPPYEAIYSAPATPPQFQPKRQLVKRDTPKRLPKLENVSGSLKLTNKNEVIEMIAEKPRSFIPKELPFHINKIEVTTLQAYSKLPTLNPLHSIPSSTTTNNNKNTTSTNNNNNFNNSNNKSTLLNTPTGSIVRRTRSDSIKKVHELQHELNKIDKSLSSLSPSPPLEDRQHDIKQVQDNIQQLQNIHHTTKQQKNKNKDNNKINTDGIMQNIQNITQIQQNIHQTQSILHQLQQQQQAEEIITKTKARNSLELDENYKIDHLFATPPAYQASHVNPPPSNPSVVLGSYLPRIVFRRFEGIETEDVSSRGTFFDSFWGVVLFADISGFTAITKRLLKLGTEGLEFLKNNLSDYFDDLVSLIHEMGGDVISFSGDAVVAVWWSETSKTDTDERIRLARLASTCSLLIQKSLSNRRYQIKIAEEDELVLNLRVAVSASHLCGVHVGGVNGRWLFTAYGTAITDIAEAMTLCVIGEVVISFSVWRLIQGCSVADISTDKFLKLQQTEPLEKPKPLEIDYAPEMAEWMKLYISPVILSRLTARQEGFVGEFRTVTVLFICIHSINFQTTKDNPPPTSTKNVAHPFLAEAFPRKRNSNSNSHSKSLSSSQAGLNSIAQFALAQKMRKNSEDAGDATHERRDSNAEDAISSLWRRNADTSAGDAGEMMTLLQPRKFSDAVEPYSEEGLQTVASLSASSSSSRLCVSYAEGLDAYVDSARARASTLQRSLTYDATDISHNLQLAVTTIQTELLTLEGDVNKLVADDKGLIAVAVFGLPPMSHEDDPLRGVLAAISIRNQLLALNMECSIGVSTGKAFCGNYGSKGHNRKEYTVIGDSVNTAARLMQKANKHILCDSFSHKFAASKVWFESLEPVVLKGYESPVPVFKPEYIRLSTKSENPNHQLFGRTKEQETLVKHATLLQRNHRMYAKKKNQPAETKETTKLIVIEGDQGVGKTTLVGAMLQNFKNNQVTVVESISDPYKNNGPLHGIWPIFTQFLELTQDVVSNRLRVLSIVADNQNWMRLVPLLNRYLPLEFPSNPLCNELSDNARIESTIYIVTQMLKVMAREKPMIIVFENAQWLDRQSWVVLSDVLRQIRYILVIALMRPTAEPIEALTLLKNISTKIKLDLMDKETTSQIIVQQIGTKSLPPSIMDTIYTRAQGNPLMCVEVAHYLLSSGVMVIGDDGDCILTGDLDVDNVNIPSSMESMITARIDKLLPGPLLTLKVAAIIGKTVSVKLLESIYPIPDAKSELLENLLALRKLGILSFEDYNKSDKRKSPARARKEDDTHASAHVPVPAQRGRNSREDMHAKRTRAAAHATHEDHAKTQIAYAREDDVPAQRIRMSHEEALAHRDARVLEQVHGKVTYTFKDCLYMEVAYNLMLFAQKRQLHEQVAKWYEAAMEAIPRNKQSKLFNFLIHHWEAAGNKERAQHYQRRAIVMGRWATLRKVLFSQRLLLRFFGRSPVKPSNSFTTDTPPG